MNGLAGLAALCTLCMLVRGHAFAQPAADGGGSSERARLTLVQELCVTRSYDPAAFSGLLQIELQSLHVELEQAQSLEALGARDPGLAIVHVGCEAAEAQLRIELIDVLTGKHIERAMLVNDIERSARPRALALLVTTTIESSWTELTMPRDAASQAALPEPVRQRLHQRLSIWLQPSAAPTAAAPRAPQPELQPQPIARKNAIALAGAMRVFPARNTGLIGADLAMSRSFEPLRLVVDLEALLGSQELSDNYGRFGHYALSWITAGAALLWVSTSRPELSVGPFFRLGYAAAKGSSERDDYTAKNEGSVVSALGLSAVLRAEASRDFDLWFGVDLGYVLNGVVFLADLARPSGMADMTVGARLGASFEF